MSECQYIRNMAEKLQRGEGPDRKDECQRWSREIQRVLDERDRLRAELQQHQWRSIESAIQYAYNSGYNAGHEDTAEGNATPLTHDEKFREREDEAREVVEQLQHDGLLPASPEPGQ